MRVTIEHREETTGLTQSHKESFIDCKVEFSEEERAIIKARDLYRESFIVGVATQPPSTGSILGPAAMKFFGPILIIASFIVGFATGSEGFSGFMFVLGIGLTIYGWWRSWRVDRRLDTDDQLITIRQLLSNPSFTVHALNAGYAKAVEEDIRDHLVSLKTLIQSSTELPAKQTFEL